MWKRWTKPGKADNAIPNEQKDTNGKLGIPGFEMITFSELEQEPELYEIEDSGLQKELCKIFPGVETYLLAQRSWNNLVRFKSDEMYRGTLPIDGEGFGTVNSTGLAIVRSYYLDKIRGQLNDISFELSNIKDFSDTEFSEHVFSYIANLKEFFVYQMDKPLNDVFNTDDVVYLESFEQECSFLLGNVNLTLSGFAGKLNLKFGAYEKNVHEVQKWLGFQKALLATMYRIEELRYVLTFGAAQRNQPGAMILALNGQVEQTLQNLRNWHLDYARRLDIDTVKLSRRKDGDADVVLSGIFSFVQHNEWNYCDLDPETAKLIDLQLVGHDQLRMMDTSRLYEEDLELIIHKGKIFYHPNLIKANVQERLNNPFTLPNFKAQNTQSNVFGDPFTRDSEEREKSFTADVFQKGKAIADEAIQKSKPFANDVLHKGLLFANAAFEKGKALTDEALQKGKPIASEAIQKGKEFAEEKILQSKANPSFVEPENSAEKLPALPIEEEVETKAVSMDSQQKDSNNEFQLEVTTDSPDMLFIGDPEFDFDKKIFDLNEQIDLLTSSADSLDYLVAAASGVLCASMDILWVGEFNLEESRNFASEKTDGFVKTIAHKLGCQDDDLQSCVKFLEVKFPMASDGNTPGFGGGLQHHLRDFAHHPSILGLIFSLMTQFTYKSYGTDTTGKFIVLDVPERSRQFIGTDVPQKILYGTINWFFHLVSDMAGSSSTAGITGGTGIPGPVLSLAKEMSALPFFRNLKIGDDTLPVVVSKLFNGTLLAQHDASGKVIKGTEIKFDLRAELGIAAGIAKQSLPVIVNECIVRGFYFLRRLAMELRRFDLRTVEALSLIQWSSVVPGNNPTISRMLTVSTGVFSTIDISEALITQKYWVGINYPGVCRFAMAIGQDVGWCLKARDVKQIRRVYEEIKRNTYSKQDQNLYSRIGNDIEDAKNNPLYATFCLTVEQTEILYNLERYKTLNDAAKTQSPFNADRLKKLKYEWIEEWMKYMSAGFASVTQTPGAELHWYSEEDLRQKVLDNNPQGIWFKQTLLEAMVFKPYYDLGIVKDKDGKDIPDPKYKDLKTPFGGYNEGLADSFLDHYFEGDEFPQAYVKRLRKCYKSVKAELSEVQKAAMKKIGIAGAVTVATVATAGIVAPHIAVALVGTHFAGLSGAALTSASLAYLGGGAIAAGGAGMMGGVATIVGGGAVLGLGVGAGVGGLVGQASIAGKEETILQSAKLMVSVREIFINDNHDVAYSNTVIEQYTKNIMTIEQGLVEMRLKADIASPEEKKKLEAQIKNAEESVKAMKIARKSLSRFVSSYEEGLKHEQE